MNLIRIILFDLFLYWIAWLLGGWDAILWLIIGSILLLIGIIAFDNYRFGRIR